MKTHTFDDVPRNGKANVRDMLCKGSRWRVLVMEDVVLRSDFVCVVDAVLSHAFLATTQHLSTIFQLSFGLSTKMDPAHARAQEQR